MIRLEPVTHVRSRRVTTDTCMEPSCRASLGSEKLQDPNQLRSHGFVSLNGRQAANSCRPN
jgi:hypothetical protein